MSSADLSPGVVVVGSANVDIVCRVANLPAPGETVMAAERMIGAGGKGANQAVAAARSGAPTQLLCSLGDDGDGRRLRDGLEAAGVTVLGRRSAVPTGSAYILVDSRGENSIVVASGANAELVDLQAEETAAISSAAVVLLQLETPFETVRASIAAARAAGTLVVLNAAPFRSLPGCLVGDVDVLIVNEHEAAQLAAERQAAGDSSDTGSPRLATITTLGGRGVRLTGDGFRDEIDAQEVDVVDTIGAGDTFCGGFAAALVEHGTLTPTGRLAPTADEIVAAARYAMEAATLSVQRAGASSSIPTRLEVDAALALRHVDRSLAKEER